MYKLRDNYKITIFNPVFVFGIFQVFISEVSTYISFLFSKVSILRLILLY